MIAEVRTTAEKKVSACAHIEKALRKLEEVTVMVAASSVSLRPHLDEAIHIALDEAEKHIRNGEEYTGFSYIRDLIYLYAEVSEYQCKEGHENYGEQVQQLHTKLHMLETLQYAISVIEENRNRG
jgi:hypothetical protein